MKKTIVTPIFVNICQKRGIEILVEPSYGFVARIKLPNGRYTYFRGANFDINPQGAMEIAKDKDYTNFFLQDLGYQIIPGHAFFTTEWARLIGAKSNGPQEALIYAQQLGWPVLVKPNSLSQGKGVYKVYDDQEFIKAVNFISKKDRVFLVQQYIEGNDYRIVVLDNEIISAYQRLPLNVIGDGRSTILQLLDEKQQNFNQIGRDTRIRKNDPRIDLKLKRQELTFESILPKNEKVNLLDNCNLSSGGDAIDVTKEIHQDYVRLCCEIVKNMNLRYCGVDLMIKGDIRDSLGEYYIIEINAAPGLDNYSCIGQDQERIVERLYSKVLDALIKLQ